MANIEGKEFLAKPYIGRMVMVGLSPDGAFWRQFSAIGGRSDGSRNRKYIQVGRTIETAPYDPSKPSGDPEKTIYTTQKSNTWNHVVSNGRQTDSFLAGPPSFSPNNEKTFEHIQQGWQTEGPDSDYTARITGRVYTYADRIILGRVSQNKADRSQSDYESYRIGAIAGHAFFITTYNGEGGTDPAIYTPLEFRLSDRIEEDLENLWGTLDASTKVALVGRDISTGNGEFQFAPPKSIYDKAV